MATYGTVEEYLAAQPQDAHDVLVNIRALVHEALPDGEEWISYDVPTFGRDHRALVHAAGWRRHVSVYPVPGATEADPELGDDLAPYVAGRGTLRFELAEEVPYDLVRRVVAALVARSR